MRKTVIATNRTKDVELNKLKEEMNKISDQIDKIVNSGGRVSLTDPLSKKYQVIKEKIAKLKRQNK